MITCNRKALISALDRCAKIAQTKATMPMLSHALLEHDGKRISYRATNISLTVTGSLEATGDTAAFTVNPRDALSALGALDGDDAKIETGAGFIRLSAKGKRSFKIPTLAADEFPSAPECDGVEVTIPAGTLLGLVRGVAFAVAPEADDREQLKAVRVFRENGGLTSLAGNGRVGARASVKSKTDLDIVIPSAGCKALIDSVGDGDVMVTAGRLLRFSWGSDALYVTPPAAAFPGIGEAFKLRPANSAKFNADELANAVSAVQRVDAERDVVLTFKPGALTVESHGQGHGYASDEIEVTYDGAPMQLGLSAGYLSDALAAAGDEVTAHFTNDPEGFDPFVLESDGWTGIIMPLRLQTLRDKGKL